MRKSFEDIMNLALEVRRSESTGKAFTSSLEEAVNTFSTGGIRSEARDYGVAHPEEMITIGLAWITAMDYAYHEGRVYMDGRNEVACTRCHELRSQEGMEVLIQAIANNEDNSDVHGAYMNMFAGFIRHTLVQMHRTNIQTATQVIFEGFQAAVENSEDSELYKILKEATQYKGYFTQMPLI